MGAGIFSSSSVGWLLYLAHTAASLTVGLMFRFYKHREPAGRGVSAESNSAVNIPQVFVGAVSNSFQTILSICAFVIFFAVAIRMLYVFGVLGVLGSMLGMLLKPLGVPSGLAERLLSGIIEVTSGLRALQDVSVAVTQKLAMAAFMLGWAGLSVHCQVLTFIGKSGLSSATYIVGKMLHGLLSTVYILLIMHIFDFHLPVSKYLLEEVNNLSQLDFGSTLSGTLRVSLIICAVMLLWAAALLLKRNWKRI